MDRFLFLELPDKIVPSKLLTQFVDIGFRADMDIFDIHDLCEIPEHFLIDSKADDGVVSAAGIDPRFSRGLQARQGLPQNARYRQVGHIVLLLLADNVVDDHAEPVAHIAPERQGRAVL